MKKLVPIVLVALAAACNRPSEAPKESAAPPAATAPPPATADVKPAPPVAGWTVTEGVATPESIYFDEASGFIFSSQIVGMDTEHDGNGRIAKLGGDGTVIDANWVTGLNAPKGLRSYQGTLWTADIDEMVGIDIASGRVTSRVKIPGAQYLNDVAVGADGTVYTSDMLANKIYAVNDGQASVFAEGEAMEYPNGLLVKGDALIVGGWGKPEADFSTKVPGRLFAVDLKTKKKTLITPKPFGNIDGLEADGRGGYLVTDFNKGQLTRISAKGDAVPVKEFKPGAADIGFIAAKGIVLVPHMNENQLAAYDISDAFK